MGSPPRMRGKDTNSADSRRSLRITPAYAGKSERQQLAILLHQDHPRTCGEKGSLPVLRSIGLGSPPHMRGKDGFGMESALTARITPAHAGKSHHRSIFSAPAWDHPRTCGEKHNWYYLRSNILGSPPHMRGKDSKSRKRKIFLVDHPRTCGEKTSKT